MPMAGSICAKYTIIIYNYNYTQFESYQYLYSAENSCDIKMSSILTQELIQSAGEIKISNSEWQGEP